MFPTSPNDVGEVDVGFDVMSVGGLVAFGQFLYMSTMMMPNLDVFSINVEDGSGHSCKESSCDWIDGWGTTTPVIKEVYSESNISRVPSYNEVYGSPSSISNDDVMDGVQAGLDAVGLVPGFGELADGINAGIYLARGDYVNAGFSAVAMIPFVGWAGTVGKWGKKGVIQGGKTAYRYVSKGEALIAKSRGLVPNISKTGKIKNVFYTSKKYFDVNFAEEALQIGKKNPLGVNPSPTHRITVDSKNANWIYGGNIDGGTGVELITNMELPVMSIDEIF